MKVPSLLVGLIGAVSFIVATGLLLLMRNASRSVASEIPLESRWAESLLSVSHSIGFGTWSVTGLVAVAGAVTMRRLRGWWLAVVAAVVVMSPCGLCFFGFPIGAWALWRLTSPEVRSRFR